MQKLLRAEMFNAAIASWELRVSMRDSRFWKMDFFDVWMLLLSFIDWSSIAILMLLSILIWLSILILIVISILDNGFFF